MYFFYLTSPPPKIHFQGWVINKHLFSKALEPVDVGYILITTTQVVVRMGLVLPSNLRLLYLCNASTQVVLLLYLSGISTWSILESQLQHTSTRPTCTCYTWWGSGVDIFQLRRRIPTKRPKHNHISTCLYTCLDISFQRIGVFLLPRRLPPFFKSRTSQVFHPAKWLKALLSDWPCPRLHLQRQPQLVLSLQLTTIPGLYSKRGKHTSCRGKRVISIVIYCHSN